MYLKRYATNQKTFFEIQFVEHEQPLLSTEDYALQPVYKLSCTSLFEYSSTSVKEYEDLILKIDTKTFTIC